jgi:hypothetical protein
MRRITSMLPVAAVLVRYWRSPDRASPTAGVKDSNAV